MVEERQEHTSGRFANELEKPAITASMPSRPNACAPASNAASFRTPTAGINPLTSTGTGTDVAPFGDSDRRLVQRQVTLVQRSRGLLVIEGGSMLGKQPITQSVRHQRPGLSNRWSSITERSNSGALSESPSR
jgi:hypothetical protein